MFKKEYTPFAVVVLGFGIGYLAYQGIKFLVCGK
jgi:hypothetical protein